MQALSKEQFQPVEQPDENNPIVYTIKPLKPTQITELMADGCKVLEGGRITLSFKGIMMCLRYGLEGVTNLDEMHSSHHAEVAQAIFNKALLAEKERKNSSSQLK